MMNKFIIEIKKIGDYVTMLCTLYNYCRYAENKIVNVLADQADLQFVCVNARYIQRESEREIHSYFSFIQSIFIYLFSNHNKKYFIALAFYVTEIELTYGVITFCDNIIYLQIYHI